MPLLSIRNVGTQGVIADGYTTQQPVEAWHVCHNAIPLNTELQVAPSSRLIISGHFSTFTPLFAAMTWLGAGLQKLFLFGRGVIYAVASETTVIDLIEAPLTETSWPVWIPFLFGNVPIANDSTLVNPPQYYEAATNLWKKLPGLTYPGVTSLACKTLREAGPYLVMLGPAKNGIRYPNMIKWSSSADPGTVPSSWNEADLSNDAGEAVIPGNSIQLFDLFPLKDFWVLYGSEGIWRLSLTGDTFVFQLTPMFPELGAFCQRCAVTTPLGQVALVVNDVIIHDGFSYKSIIYGKTHEALFREVARWPEHVYLVSDINKHEVLICLPQASSEVDGVTVFGATLAFCWNWQTQTWVTRDLPYVPSLTPAYPIWGIFSQTIDTDTRIIVTATELIDPPVTPTYEAHLLGPTRYAPFASPFHTTQLVEINQNTATDYLNRQIVSVMEKYDLAIIGQNRQGDWEIDVEFVKLLTRVIPVVHGLDTQLRCWVGARMQLTEPVHWEEAVWNSVRSCFDCSLSGRYLSVKFAFSSSPWAFSGYDLDLTVVGKY